MTDSSFEFALDRYHLQARLAVVVSTVITIALGAFVIVPWLLRALRISETPGFLGGMLGGLLLAIAWAPLAERIVVALWPSGRILLVEADGLRIEGPGEELIQIRWEYPVEATTWYFAVQRQRSWVPRGWYVISLRLVQGEEYLIPYTFCSPEDAKTLKHWEKFSYLISQKMATSDGLLDDETQLVLRLAEDQRSVVGAEMLFADFAQLLDAIAPKLPGWTA